MFKRYVQEQKYENFVFVIIYVLSICLFAFYLDLLNHRTQAQYLQYGNILLKKRPWKYGCIYILR